MRVWLVVSLVLVFLLGSLGAEAKSRLRPRKHRRFHWGLLKAVRAVNQPPHWFFLWKSASGKVYRYRARRLPAGLQVRLRRLLAQGTKRFAVGGKYALSSGKKGWVEVSTIYPISRVYRGVRVVKLDGRMPRFTATWLPATSEGTPRVYQLRGTVSTHMEDRDNKLVCLYGTWFDIKGRTLGMVSQTRGLKGRSLFRFSRAYKHPRHWSAIRDFSKKLRAYQEAQRRKKKGLPPLKRVIRFPRLPRRRWQRYHRLCLQRLRPVERWLSSPNDPLLRPRRASIRRAPSSRRAPSTRPAPTSRPASVQPTPSARPASVRPMPSARRLPPPRRAPTSRRAPASRPVSSPSASP